MKINNNVKECVYESFLCLFLGHLNTELNYKLTHTLTEANVTHWDCSARVKKRQTTLQRPLQIYIQTNPNRKMSFKVCIRKLVSITPNPKTRRWLLCMSLRRFFLVVLLVVCLGFGERALIFCSLIGHIRSGTVSVSQGRGGTGSANWNKYRVQRKLHSFTDRCRGSCNFRLSFFGLKMYN